MRIVSLVPSLTHFLIDLGLENQLVGRTRFCIHPKEIVTKIPIIGGTKNPSIEKILNLKPDLIIASKEENIKEHIEELQTHVSVLLTDINTIEEAFTDMLEIGRQVNRLNEAQNWVNQIKNELPEEPTHFTTCLYMIWKDPYMAAGTSTYVNDVLHRFGLKNMVEIARYPEISIEEMQNLAPEIVMLSSEPYPFKEKHRQELAPDLPKSTLKLVDGEWFSWYGSAMLKSFQGLKKWVEEV